MLASALVNQRNTHMSVEPVKPLQRSAAAAAAKSLQLCPTRRDPIDVSPPGSPIPGILQARPLEWVAVICISLVVNICSNPLPVLLCLVSFAYKSPVASKHGKCFKERTAVCLR